MRTIGGVAVSFLAPIVAQAATLRELGNCLVLNDVPCAEAQADALGAWSSPDPAMRAAAAEVHFHAGRYADAYDTMKIAVGLGFPDRHQELSLYERTMIATAGWTEERRGRFRVRWRPGLDDLLLDDAMTTLQLAERHIAPLLGGPPPGETILELYPDGRSFIAASSLMKTDVETTGVVALSKWTRLLVTSPRVLGRGYDWTDTIAHEYIHLVVAHRGNGSSTVPVWLQEAVAKYLDARWQDGMDHFALTVRQQGLLAEALRHDDLVTFDEMHPSLAKLETAERAALAYAQLATLMQFCFLRGGEEVLLRVLPSVKEGKDPRVALAHGAGFETFEQMMSEWREWVAGLDLVSRKLAALPVQLDGGDELDLDPSLAAREDLKRNVRLGRKLQQDQFHEAALVYFGRALPEDEPPSPVLTHGMAEAHLALDQVQLARAMLEASALDYPEFPFTHVLLGRIYSRMMEPERAILAFREAAALNPFDPEPHEALVRLFAQVGDRTASERHARLLGIRASGGDDIPRVLLHERSGELVVPDYDARPPGTGTATAGKKAPQFDVAGLLGGRLSLGEHLGKVVVVDFWATWCGPCRQMMPHLSSLQERRGDDGLVVLGLTEEGPDKVRPFLKQNPVSYSVGVDAQSVNASYGVTSLPTAVVVGRDGRIVDVVVGAGPRALERLDAAVNDGLARVE